MSIFSVPFFSLVVLLCLAYFLLPKRCQWVVLLIASCLFYLSGGLKGCVYILVTIITQYLLAMGLERRNREMAEELSRKELSRQQKKDIKQRYGSRKKMYVILSLAINIGILAFLKLANLAVGEINTLFGTDIRTLNLLLPLGLSYYTFKSVGYVIDVYRGRVPAEKNIFKLALFIGYFPALFQGPIDRYEDLAGQLTAEHDFDYNRLCFGAQRMLWGYIKKLVIADRIAVIADRVIENYAVNNYEGFTLFFAFLLMMFRLYADFSGGMDIVNGLSEIFGIRLTENFERPFFATSVSDYWKRWHITLGAWMRTYVFYPLSLSSAFNKLGKKCRSKFGDRVGKLIAPSLASFITFLLLGLWHGAGWKYVIYGLYMAVFVSCNTLLEPVYADMRERLKIDAESKGWHLFQILRTIMVITLSRYVVAAKSLTDTGKMLKATFTHFNPWVFFDGSFYQLGLDRPNFILMFLSIAVLLAVDFAQEKGIHIRESIARQGIVVRWGIYYAAIFVLLIFGMYGPGYDAASFIYQRF